VPSDRPRIAFLDALRGLGVLGILAVNVSFMAATFEQTVVPQAWPFANEGASLAAWFVVHVFFESKFITLFSLLFGASAWLVGGDPGDAVRARALRRRLGWLALFGLLHGAVVWYGDVLLDYAVAGVLVLACRGWSARRLLAAGGLGFVAGLLVMTLAPPLLGLGTLVPAAPPPPAAFQGGFAGSLQANLVTWAQYRALVAFFTLPYCAPLMLLGLGLFKAGVLGGAAAPRVYRAGLLAGALALALHAAATFDWMRAGFADGGPAARDELLLNLTSPFVAFGYLSALALAGRRLTVLLAPLGRMAFSNYIAQSLLVTALTYGGRGPGWFDRLDRPALALVVVLVWALQIAWSRWWLRRFASGPLEWAWHRLTWPRPRACA